MFLVSKSLIFIIKLKLFIAKAALYIRKLKIDFLTICFFL